MKKRYLLAFTTLALFAGTAFCQQAVKPQVLTKAQWQQYFAKNFNIKHAEKIKLSVAATDIPYPDTWWYAGDADKTLKDKYLLYKINSDADFMFMPANSGVSTYLFYFNHKHPEKDWVELNFVADSVLCTRLADTVYMFQLNDNGFKIGADTSGLKRYMFVSAQGKIVQRSIVAHTCRIAVNNIDTIKKLIYLNVVYPTHPGCRQCFRVDYHNFFLFTDMDDVEDLNGTIVIDEVHYVALKRLSAAENN